ncbi:TerB family tellurite resistance protein [Enterovirga sp.]|uniref:tellurite resistance TerB family protein n=1 Tax=Enterovirga sp. TaxID=2026350 RepID=UPI00260AFC6E|nr:TerB family tellurite resistance protein [Enterovirga sp.]
MTFVKRLSGLLRQAHGGQAGPDPDALSRIPDDRLAAAALLVHVARVDGRIVGPERLALVLLLADRFGLPDEAASAMVAQADALDREVDGVSGLMERVGLGGDEADRTRLLGMAYGIAAADGLVGEFEEDLVWRMGRFLGFDDEAIGATRAEVLGRG